MTGVSDARGLANRPDASRLSSINVPTLVIGGEDDPLCSFEAAQMMQAQISRAQLHVAPGAAHAPLIEKPENAGAAIAEWSFGMRGSL